MQLQEVAPGQREGPQDNTCRMSWQGCHTSAFRDKSAFFPHWVLLVAVDSFCTSWGSCSPGSWVLLIHRLSLEVTTPESFKLSFRLEAGSARLCPASSFSKRWRLLATPTGATKNSVREEPEDLTDSDLWMAEWYLSSFSPNLTGSLTLALRVRVVSELFILGLIRKEMVLGLERRRELL